MIILFFQGMREHIEKLSLAEILPRTNTFITYEGSITQPGCQETVTWIILNKPLHITHIQVWCHIVCSSYVLLSILKWQTIIETTVRLIKSEKNKNERGNDKTIQGQRQLKINKTKMVEAVDQFLISNYLVNKVYQSSYCNLFCNIEIKTPTFS